MFITPVSKPDYSARPQTIGRENRTKFFESNMIGYNPVQESQNGAMIRMVKDGSLPSQLARKDEIKRV